jgi:hypothetical protein
MKHVHVECLPDETLIRKLGFTKQFIRHHSGKSRIMKKLKEVSNELAIMDEDPGTAKTTYEKGLKYIGNEDGIKQYTDHFDNKVIILQGKLEDWILAICKRYKIDINAFGLPAKSSELHEIINDRLENFERLISHLLQSNNKAINTIKSYLK